MLGSPERAAFLLQAAGSSTEGRHEGFTLAGASSMEWLCNQGSDCQVEALYMLMLVLALLVSVVTVLTSFTFFREDKEEQITPLCPRLVVKDDELGVSFPLHDDAHTVVVSDQKGRVHCRMHIEWP